MICWRFVWWGVRVRSIRATHLGFDEHLNPTNLRFVDFERQTGPIDDLSTNVGHLYGCELMEDALKSRYQYRGFQG